MSHARIHGSEQQPGKLRVITEKNIPPVRPSPRHVPSPPCPFPYSHETRTQSRSGPRFVPGQHRHLVPAPEDAGLQRGGKSRRLKSGTPRAARRAPRATRSAHYWLLVREPRSRGSSAPRRRTARRRPETPRSHRSREEREENGQKERQENCDLLNEFPS